MSEENKGKEEVVIKPLTALQPKPIWNWNEWLVRWQLAWDRQDFETLESLLHNGFGGNVSFNQSGYYEKKYDHIDRLIAYFTLAEGWADYYLLKSPTEEEGWHRFGYDQNGNQASKSTSDLRKQLAHKAFDMLCQNFFKEEKYRHEESEIYFWRMVFSERLLPIIQNFFRTEKASIGDRIEIRNLHPPRFENRSHNEQLAVDFLLKIAELIWKQEKLSRLDEAKPWLVEILVQLDKLDVLRQWMFKLDQPCLDKLREIAMRSKLRKYDHHVEEDRLVATFDEARYVGSKAAWFLEEYRLKKKEDERLQEIRETDREIEAAQLKKKKLAAKR